MLHLHWLSNLKSKEQIWQSFNPKTDLWLVGQLRSKLALKNNLWEKFGALAFEPVLKTDDFIHSHLTVCNPELQSLNRLASKVYLKKVMSKFEYPWIERPGTVDWLLNEFENLFNLVAAPEVEDIFQELVAADSFQSSQIFGEVVNVLRAFFADCQENKRFPDFSVGHFIDLKKLPKFDRKIYVDLGCSMTLFDSEFIKRVSQFYDLEILIPAASSDELFSTSQTGYLDLLTTGAGTKEIKKGKSSSESKIKVWHETSIIGEVHATVTQIRHWVINEEVRPDRIAVLSPNPEHYFPVLKDYLISEGIPFSSPATTPFASLKGFQALMSRLKMLDSQFSPENLMEALDPVEFRKAPLSLVDAANLNQIPNLKSRIRNIANDLPGSFNLKAFESTCLRICKNTDLDESFVLTVFQSLRLEVGYQLELSLSEWIWILAEKISKQGFSAESNSEWGVSLLPIEGSEECFFDRVLILGFTQEKEPTGALQLLNPIQRKILLEMGFDRITSTDQKFRNIANQFINGGCDEIVLSVPVVDFSGSPSVPSLLWLHWEALVGLTPALESKPVFLLEQKRPLGTKALNYLEAEISGKRKMNLLQVPEFHVSASSIEDYFTCPFLFYVRSVLKLRAPEEWELDPSAMRAGGWLHNVIEKIMKSESPIDEFTDQKIRDELDLAGEIYLKMVPDLWQYLVPQYNRLIKDFVRFERDYRNTSKIPVGRFFEEEVNGFIFSEENRIVFSKDKPKSGGFKFLGKIDRIDVTPNQESLIVDYKTGTSNQSNIKAWAKNGELQLFLYSRAIECRLTSAPPNVAGAFYHSLKASERRKGFYKEEKMLESLTADPRWKPSDDGVLSFDDYENISSQLDLEVTRILKGIEASEFDPKPKDTKSCEKCDWRGHCRAQHLL